MQVNKETAMKRIIERTEDGSATLFVPELNEHYHSTKGARTESQHIFVDMGLKASVAPTPQVLEIGFGTGLNAWLTLVEAERSQRHVHYTGLELYPLDWEMVEPLSYIAADEQIQINDKTQNAFQLFNHLHTAPWGESVAITPHFTLQKIQVDANAYLEINQGSSEDSSVSLEKPGADIVYFDAFAPEKQPDLWSQELFDHLYVLLNKGGILTTYCAKGVVRRMLQSAGFTVERLPGPPGGKREILRAGK